MTKQKPGWKYIYSESLKQEIAVHLKTGWVYCKDGSKYSPKEIAMLKENKTIVTQKIHNIKKTFEGEITKIELTASQKQKKEEELEIW
ncbi:hypothetical protein [Treponema denticola]|uniref:hypothetical protein n=1 Tax=Treponema denticola TaxID=158 RepID=UPI0002B4F117|nr:hypothetical protein [Treponema denticola]EMB43572.1 hypothetical protein HMPREF9730_02385 [Treponema denticola AL-2]